MIVHCDGSCYYKDKRMGVGIAFFETGVLTPFRSEAITIVGLGSSNEAEYYAIIQALYIIYASDEMQASTHITINTDSELIFNQITGGYVCRDEGLKELLGEVLRLVKEIKNSKIWFNWVPRTDERQQIVDRLSKQANPYFSERVRQKGEAYKTKKK